MVNTINIYSVCALTVLMLLAHNVIQQIINSGTNLQCRLWVWIVSFSYVCAMILGKIKFLMVTTGIYSNTVYRELFAKENCHDMSIVSLHEKMFMNLVIQLCIISFLKRNNTRRCSQCTKIREIHKHFLANDSRYIRYVPDHKIFDANAALYIASTKSILIMGFNYEVQFILRAHYQ